MRDEINANYNAVNVEPMRDVAVKGRNRVHFFRGIRMDAESSMNGEGWRRTTVRGKFRPFTPPFRGVDGMENGKPRID